MPAAWNTFVQKWTSSHVTRFYDFSITQKIRKPHLFASRSRRRSSANIHS